MAWKIGKKAQSSLEYLLTYGWALILIASLVAVLVLVVGGGVNTNTCTTFLTMLCKGVGADGDTLMLVLQNSTGQKITINPFLDIKFDDKEGYATVTYNGTEHRFDDVTINAGDEFTVSARGLVHAEEVSITYVEGSTGLTRTITSTIGTDALDTIEISNDGIDNDGDGDIDCTLGFLTNCEYVVESQPLVGNITIDDVVPYTITFDGVIAAHGSEDLAAGPWIATNPIDPDHDSPFAFYVESYTPGSAAIVQFDPPWGPSAQAQNVRQGWNVVEIDMGAGYMVMGNDMPDFSIIADTPEEFTLSGAHRPKALLILNSP